MSQIEEEKARVGAIASAVIDELSRRYNLQPDEILSALSWWREHREFVGKLKHSGYMALVGTLIATSLMVAWEGVKAIFRKEMP